MIKSSRSPDSELLFIYLYFEFCSYIQCGISTKSSVAEFLSAMAAGYNARLTVEAWKNDSNINGESIATSIGLAIATRHNRGRYVDSDVSLFQFMWDHLIGHKIIFFNI